MNINDLHPSIKNNADLKKAHGGKLTCHCSDHAVEVLISGHIEHNHLCGCSACWKPKGALFSQIGVVAKDQLTVTANQHKLRVVNEKAAIKRHACQECGVHMLGQVSDPDHHYFGIDFVHLELAEKGGAKIEFAGYVSSLIESGVEASVVAEVRNMLADMGISCYDTMSPAIMDVISYHKLKLSKKPLF